MDHYALQWVVAVAATFTAGILVKLIDHFLFGKIGPNQKNGKKRRKGGAK